MSPYVPPGVYVRFLEKGYIPILPGMVRIPAIIGEGKVTKQVDSEPVIRGAGSSDTLEHSGVISIEKIGDVPLSSDYTTDDYSFTEEGVVTWKSYPYFGIGVAPDEGQTYYVTYTYVKTEEDYKPKLFFSLEDVENEYGVASSTNTITLAAQIMFENGATAVMCSQIDSEDFDTALNNLQNKDCDIIVPLTTNIPNLVKVKNHVVSQSTELNKHERIAFVGAPIGSDIEYFFNSEETGLAQMMHHMRVVVFAPDGVKKSIKDVEGTIEEKSLSGAYLAAAGAGILANPSYVCSEPLTRKPLNGFNELLTEYNESEKNAMGARGITVVHTSLGGIVVRDGITTDLSSINYQEISVVSLIDYTKESMRSALDRLIGTIITSSTPINVASTVVATLGKLVDAHIIAEYRSVKAKVDAIDLRKINVGFDIYPVYPLKWIRVSFSWYSG